MHLLSVLVVDHTYTLPIFIYYSVIIVFLLLLLKTLKGNPLVKRYHTV